MNALDERVPYRPTDALIEAQAREVGVEHVPEARVFVAGAIAELGRASLAIRALRRCLGPDCITRDWTEPVIAAMNAGRLDQSLTHDRRVAIATENALGVEQAGCFWLLASRYGVDSLVELGLAIALRRRGRPIHVVVSGGYGARIINAELADVRAAHDHEGLLAVAQWARELARSSEVRS